MNVEPLSWLVKLLFDENLSPELVRRIEDLFPGSAHVHDLGLGASEDAAVWQHALSNDFTIVSKDSDFHDRGILHGFPPKVLWIRLGNCSTSAVDDLLRRFHSEIKRFGRSAEEALLTLP